ncbi:hypothetical protein [Streptomyces sp. SID13726]|uniref:hypothetical protein n=1 Tax=Streptomyces sp. SID13726 TaxID=2706058 RepID=UPI0013B87B87|nr:hypothetical protein [Streptomyces sp. SID13726]NEB05646.1 hypothetical protein [Streptomyces sp. SID13726]
MHFLRRAMVFLASLATLTGATVFLASPAQAATSCSGTITYSDTVSRSGSVIGELVIYYNSSNGGTNSACFYHRGVSYGVTAYTSIQIYRCSQTSGTGDVCNPTQNSLPDDGNYAYYAGPVGVTGTANYCVSAIGSVTWAGRGYSIETGTRGC